MTRRLVNERYAEVSTKQKWDKEGQHVNIQYTGSVQKVFGNGI